ncbi:MULTISPECIES: hypothetical protein [unclassified Pseudonocardia]|uniref:hypothetical protein n=1 Tax=unclassified Pseudonocardia TaxID=2619320 RepID=UPI00095EA9B2|nr:MULTISPECIES: hypothetical protein [unclassified Pseudonocardia]MBN9102213.1 hypothetical protein [Pseudonocardia sp.]OJY51518.1 MAG: hypothetical protein BGP03_16545 [Pseudonocardia sp. 73-21]
MNDDELTSLFRDAASAVPEAGFDYLDVTRASQRITRRRRVALSSVAAAAVAMAGTGVVVATVRDQGTLTSAASAPAAAPEISSPPVGRSDAAGAGGVPLGPSGAECVDKQDPQLRAVVEQVLPEIIGAPAAAVSTECRAGGGRGVAVEVTDRGVSGVLSVFYSPPDQAPPTFGGAPMAPTASGGTVIASSEAEGPTGATGGPGPFADRLPSVVAYLAPRL